MFLYLLSSTGTALARNGREQPRTDRQPHDKGKVVDAGDAFPICRSVQPLRIANASMQATARWVRTVRVAASISKVWLGSIILLSTPWLCSCARTNSKHAVVSRRCNDLFN